MSKQDSKLVDQTVEIEDLRSKLKAAEDKLSEEKVKTDEMQTKLDNLSAEYKWLIETYDGFVDAVFDHLYEYNTLIKRSHFADLIRKRNEEMRQEAIKNQQVQQPENKKAKKGKKPNPQNYA